MNVKILIANQGMGVQMNVELKMDGLAKVFQVFVKQLVEIQ